jgi:hypothetical protein
MPRRRLLTAFLLAAVEAAAVLTLLCAAQLPAAAQVFNDRFPFQNRGAQPRPRGPFDWFFYPQPQHEEPRAAPAPAPAPPPVDYSKAPAAKKPEPKTDTAGLNTVMVFGDSMADWLAYGLEQAYADAPEMAVLRRHRTDSGLIRTENRNDPRGEYPDWPQAAREMIAAQKPKFVLMMIGINDRRSIRETAPVPAPAAARNAKPVPAAARPDDPAALELDKPAPDQRSDSTARSAAAASASTPPGGNRTLEFRSDAWCEAYIRRIDETLAALKTSGVPVFWVGLPPLRGQKASSDILFLNDLYRSRADRAGIIFVDVWDGFVDEDGRYAQSGPDYEGQIRRLRSGDGVHFTQAGARKLAHYAEREIQRWLNAQWAEVALPIQEEPKMEATAARPGTPAAGASGAHARPLAGPIVPLLTERSGESDDELLGGSARPPAADAMVTKVLVNGEAVPAPAGRADDFAWPRRDIAPLGIDPVVATTDLPMTPMLAERPRTGQAATSTASAATTTAVASAAAPPRPRRVTPRATAENQESYYRPDYYRRPPTFFPFQSLFGGRW